MLERTNRVRKATILDMPLLREIAQSAQDKLIHAGSVQQIAGYSYRNMGVRIEHGELYVLETFAGILGSVFVEPVTPERFPQITHWDVAPDGCPVCFLYGLVIDPVRQGQGWGRTLLDGLRHRQAFAAPAVLTLDCWAGNGKLRRFYSEAGFRLHGEFPESDYQVAVFRWTAPLFSRAL